MHAKLMQDTNKELNLFVQDANKKVKIKFAITVNADVGDTLLEVARKHKIPMVGVCGGWCRCATCHVSLEDAIYKQLPEPSETELDMLDKAKDVVQNSRPGCQVRVQEFMDGAEIVVK